MSNSRIRLIQVMLIVLLGHATHGSDLLSMHLMLLVSILVEGSGCVVPYIRHLYHLLVVTLLDVWHRWHHGSYQALSTSFSHGNIYAV